MKHESYDWLDDPFDEKKAQEERQRAQSGSGIRAAGCVVALLACAAFVVFTFVAGFSALQSLS